MAGNGRDRNLRPYLWCLDCGSRRAEPGGDRCRVCLRRPVPSPAAPGKVAKSARPATPAVEVPAVDPDDCQCARCGRPCGTCDCSRQYRRSEANQRYEEKRAPQKRSYLADYRKRPRRPNQCNRCSQDALPGLRSCQKCLDSVARSGWRRLMVTAILDASDFRCLHGSGETPCAACRRCVRQWVKANEAALRERVRRERDRQVAAAVVARDRLGPLLAADVGEDGAAPAPGTEGTRPSRPRPHRASSWLLTASLTGQVEPGNTGR